MVLASNLTEDIVNFYDYILIDCPPNLGTITLNGIYISDYYLIPVIPDILSTYGIDQIIDRINKCALDIKRLNRRFNIKPLGMLITKYRVQDEMHRTILKYLIEKGQNGALPKVFNNKIKETSRVSRIADLNTSYINLKQKYGYDNEIYDSLKNIAKEFIDRAI